MQRIDRYMHRYIERGEGEGREMHRKRQTNGQTD